MMQAKWGLITLYLMNIDFHANFTNDTRTLPAELYKCTLVIKALNYGVFFYPYLLLLFNDIDGINFYAVMTN